MAEKEVAKTTVSFNPLNDGTQLTLTTRLYNNDVAGVFYTLQEIDISNFGDGSNINIALGGYTQLTPDVLRKMANELEKFLIKNEANNLI